MVGHYRHASETPFQWRFAGEPMMVHFLVVFRLSPSHQLEKNNNDVSVGPPLTTLSGSAHARTNIGTLAQLLMLLSPLSEYPCEYEFEIRGITARK